MPNAYTRPARGRGGKGFEALFTVFLFSKMPKIHFFQISTFSSLGVLPSTSSRWWYICKYVNLLMVHLEKKTVSRALTGWGGGGLSGGASLDSPSRRNAFPLLAVLLIIDRQIAGFGTHLGEIRGEIPSRHWPYLSRQVELSMAVRKELTTYSFLSRGLCIRECLLPRPGVVGAEAGRHHRGNLVCAAWVYRCHARPAKVR